MFARRSRDIDPRITAIADHLQAIEDELGRIGQRAGRSASASASAAADQIVDTIAPILRDIGERFGRGQRLAVGEAADWAQEAARVGARLGSDALGRVSSEAKQRPLAAIAVAVGIGVLIGMASRRS